MPQANLSDLPVELFERILEDLDIFDVLRLKLLRRQAYRVICCSNRIKYRVELFLAGVEDGGHYNLAERQRFLRSYQSNWDSLTPQKTTTIPIPFHVVYELAGGVYGLLPSSSPNSIKFYRLPSFSRGIEMKEWSLTDLDFPIDDFTMECAYDLLAVFTYKSGHVKVHLLKLSDGKPHPRSRKPLLTYEIPLNPTENGWQLESVISENRLGCLFTSTSENEMVDNLVVWDWTTGDLVRVLPWCGNCSFIFLNPDTIVAGRTMEDERPSLAFFDLASDEKQITPTLTLAFPDLDVENDVPWRIRLNLGSPIRNGPEFQARVPFVVNPSQQMLLILVFTVGFDNVITLAHSIAVPLSKLQNWTRENSSFMEWENWQQSTMDIITGNPCRFTFSMGSRFVAFDVSPIVETDIPDDPEVSIAFVRNLSPYHLMRTDWNPSGTHCQGVPGVWNTIALAPEISTHRYLTRIITESTLDIFMTEDNLIILEMSPEDGPGRQMRVLSF